MPPNAPRVEDVIDDAISTRLDQLYTSLPGRILAVNAAQRTIIVQPMVKNKYEDELGVTREEILPAMSNVQLLVPGGGSDALVFPVKAGDLVWLWFASADLDQFRVSGQYGGYVNSTSGRKHSLNDAVAFATLSHGKSTQIIDGSSTVFYVKEHLLIGDRDSTERVIRGDRFRDAFDSLIDAISTFANAVDVIEAVDLDIAIVAFKASWNQYLTSRLLVP